MLNIFVVWLINAVALLLLPTLVPSIRIEGIVTALIVVLVLGLVNTLLRPLLILLTLPVTLLTLGLFIFVINALLFLMVGHWVDGFIVGGFWSALFGSLLYSIVSWLLSALILGKKERT